MDFFEVLFSVVVNVSSIHMVLEPALEPTVRTWYGSRSLKQALQLGITA